MKIAVTYENGQIFGHFGHTENFKFYDVKDGKIAGAEIVSTNGSGHGALASFLKAHNTNTLICGGIGGGARNALTDVGIEICAGVDGSADEAVNAFLEQTLVFSNEANCDHHGEGNHGTCGEHGCGSGNCNH